MLRYALQRVLMAVPVCLSVLTVVFVVVRVLPGDPAQAALGDNASQAAVQTVRTRLGLDAPLPIQYVNFLKDLLRGDFGTSMINGAPVRDQIAYNLPYTLQLMLAALSIGTVFGILAGTLSARARDRFADYVVRILSVAGLCVPAFYLGILLILVAGGELPTVGGGNSNNLRDVFAHLILPATTLGLLMTAAVSRLTRSAVLNVLNLEFVRTARAKGLQERNVLFMHAVRPALLPIVSLSGVWAVSLVGDSVTTEIVFSRPGLGKLIVGAMLQRDYTLVQSVMVVYSVLVVAINVCIDLAYGVIDPRARG
ncbi:MAG: ABC transporter permease [Chloroflexi bacterium]|nr:ABC transporter permease [Chloroflexota bacterium]